MMTKPEMWQAEFERTFRQNVVRPGADELLEWPKTTDFFEAPASSKYHLAIPGGLCLHSLHVYNRLCHFLTAEYKGAVPFNGASITIVSLLHDLCKADFYEKGWKNQKTYDPDKVAAADRWQIKHDGAGDFIWETVPTYQINEQFVYGHGEKSVFLIMQHMKLTEEEAQAIRFHMGFSIDGEMKNAAACYEKNPLALFAHFADEAATFLDETEDEK